MIWMENICEFPEGIAVYGGGSLAINFNALQVFAEGLASLDEAKIFVSQLLRAMRAN